MTTWRIERGDALTELRRLPDGLVHCVVTSPPYWALRAYHAGPGELGSEATSEEYLANQVAVFREVRRVLRDDGVCWINMGDTYSSEPGNGRGSGSTLQGGKPHLSGGRRNGAIGVAGIDTGDRTGYGNAGLIPQRLAIALQADGWMIRSMVVWAKPAPMPESVAGWEWRQHQVKVKERPKDQERTSGGNRYNDAYTRPQNLATYSPCPGCPKCAPNNGLVLRKGSWRATRSHEYIIMAAKGMGYFANQQAVMERAITEGDDRKARARNDHRSTPDAERNGLRPGSAVTTSRNPRDVQSFAPSPQGDIAPYSAPVDVQHYAAFAPALPAWCIKASCPEKCCASCGAPWAPVVERTAMVIDRTDWGNRAGNRTASSGTMREAPRSKTTSFRATCSCKAEAVPGLVLDPYLGTGTTILAALRLGMRAIGIELSDKYAALAKVRIVADNPMFNKG